MIRLDLAELRFCSRDSEEYWAFLEAVNAGRLFCLDGKLAIVALGLATEQVQLAPCPDCDGEGATGGGCYVRTCPRCGGSGVDNGSDWYWKDEPAPRPRLALVHGGPR